MSGTLFSNVNNIQSMIPIWSLPITDAQEIFFTTSNILFSPRYVFYHHVLKQLCLFSAKSCYGVTTERDSTMGGPKRYIEKYYVQRSFKGGRKLLSIGLWSHIKMPSYARDVLFSEWRIYVHWGFQESDKTPYLRSDYFVVDTCPYRERRDLRRECWTPTALTVFVSSLDM